MPEVLLVNAIPGALPLQIATLDGVAVIAGIGLTVIDAVADAVQLLAVPITVYVTLPAVLLLLFDNT